MNCLRTVLLCILGLSVLMCVAVVAIVGLFWVTDRTADLLGIAMFSLLRPAIMLGYMCIILGTVLGVAACRGEQRSV